MPTSDAQKRATSKWIQANKEKYLNSVNESKRRWRNMNQELNRIKNAEYAKKSYDKWSAFMKESKRLRNIEADGLISIF